MSSITVRPIASTDYAAWRPLWDGYNAFYERVGDTALPEEVTRATWERFFDEREPVFALVAEINGAVVGITHYLFHRSTNRIELTCYLQDLFTDPTLRSKGVGRALIEAVYQKSREAGINRVYWHTHETNATARILYDKVAKHTGFLVYVQTL